MTYGEILKIARKLRKNQTGAEKILWCELRNRKLDGVKFIRQHPVIYERNRKEFFFFIIDFYCAQYKFAIELDGKIHLFTTEHDKNKDGILKENGIYVLRISNKEVLNIEEVKNKIRKHYNYLSNLRPLSTCREGDGG